MTKSKIFANMEVTYQESRYEMVEVIVWDPDAREQASVFLDIDDVLTLKYFLEDSLKDYCDD